MGQYNPHAPYIIGPEWVPIRQANYLPDTVTEQGYTFHLDHTVTPITGAYYVESVPETRTNQSGDLIAVYREGQAELTGPIKKINIPVSAVAVTGAEITGATVAALLNPSDDFSIVFASPGNGAQLAVSFDFSPYSQQLFGKRILDVSIRYSFASLPASQLRDINFYVGYAKDFVNQSIGYNILGTEGTNTGEANEISSLSLTDLNPFWNSAVNPNLDRDIFPWRYQELARFSSSETAASRLSVLVSNGLGSSVPAPNNAFLYFMDLEITYCEETRVLYGGRKTGNLSTGFSTSIDPYTQGANLVRLRDTNLASATTTLTPGDYAVTLTHNDPQTFGGLNGAPVVNAIRELYPLPTQRGIRVSKSLVVDDEFSLEEIPVITEITLHTSSAVVTGVHPYGLQDDVPVYGTITAIQEIEDDPVLTSTSFPQVRFYARRFGKTTVPLTLVDVATGLSTVSITVEDFDALTEIVDGWREVNLRFAVPPSFSVAAGDVDWRWQATNELARNQWQVLGMGSRTFPSHSIGPASYHAPQGDTVTLTWQSPAISGTADDTLSDAVVIFSTDPPAVSGFAANVLLQDVSIAVDCNPAPPCIPSAIYYNALTWTLPIGIACDAFDRTTVAGWGSADTGQAWAIGATASQWNVAAGVGTIQPNANSSDRFATVTTNSTDNSALITFSVSALPASGTLMTGLAIRYVDGNNHYLARAQIATTGIITAALTKRVAGVATTIATSTMSLAVTAAVRYKMRAKAVGTTLALKIWLASQDEPIAWTVTATDTSITTGTAVSAFARNESAVTTQIFSYDDFSVVPFQLLDARYEIQRSDEVDTDWQTILDTTDLCITGFNDYEARVGIESDYRIRLCNALDFCGPTWATASSTLIDPGVDINGSGNSVLIFTSNESPSSNLAYVMQFEGAPIETFTFPEADEIQLMRMFGKDYFTAFHPLERGGVKFTRVMLVNLAAIPLPSLPNFNELRDLAWASLNYVCVRDELGNRWFANVRVPEVAVRMNRTIYLAQIEVSQITGTPTPISVVP